MRGWGSTGGGCLGPDVQVEGLEEATICLQRLLAIHRRCRRAGASAPLPHLQSSTRCGPSSNAAHCFPHWWLTPLSQDS
jgi:hypothetical protein